MLEEVEKEGKIEEEAHNVITSEMIQAILDQGEEEQVGEQQAHLATENEKLIGLIEKLTQKVTALESGKGDRNNRRNDQERGKGPMAWRREAPKEGESKEKTVDGKKYMHCGKCRQGKGLWTTGEGLHGNDDHDPTKYKKK